MDQIRYKNPLLNIVVPMAGLGSRFADKGFLMPKPLIDILGKPMIQWVVENLRTDANYIFIVQQSHIDQYGIDKILSKIIPNCTIFPLNGVTDGAARSVVMVSEFINNSNPLFIVNSDNMIEWDSIRDMTAIQDSGVDGGIITIEATGPSWSYASLNDAGYVEKVAEKVEISTHATTGHYYWRHGQDFVKFANQMIAANLKHNNEFYVAPVYNQAIEAGKKVKIFPVNEFWSVGKPEDLEHFLSNCDKSKV